jgi:hypothetical protein
MAVRETWVFPSDGSPPCLKQDYTPATNAGLGYVILPDLPDFVSPIDGKRYSGRTGMREHNKRHDVVPVEDLKGLPPRLTNSDIRSPQEKRADAENRKQHIINQVNRYVR